MTISVLFVNRATLNSFVHEFPDCCPDNQMRVVKQNNKRILYIKDIPLVEFDYVDSRSNLVNSKERLDENKNIKYGISFCKKYVEEKNISHLDKIVREKVSHCATLTKYDSSTIYEFIIYWLKKY